MLICSDFERESKLPKTESGYSLLSLKSMRNEGNDSLDDVDRKSPTAANPTNDVPVAEEKDVETKAYNLQKQGGENIRVGKRKRVTSGYATKPNPEKPTPHRRNWTVEEDGKLLGYIQSYKRASKEVNYKEVALKMENRTAKQCRERYENSLNPTVRRGEWSLEETIILAELISQHGQNWTKITERFKRRTYNGIKKRGRKILGEILDRACVGPGFKGKASNAWTKDEFDVACKLHMENKFSLTRIVHIMKTGRSEAELDRKLILECPCDSCKRRYTELSAGGTFRDNWSRAKAKEVKIKLLKQRDAEAARHMPKQSHFATSRGGISDLNMNEKADPVLQEFEDLVFAALGADVKQYSGNQNIS